MPLTPIQQWFFAQEPRDPHHFNQADLLAVKEPLSEEVHRVYQTWKQPPVAFVAEIPHTATGKILKTALRERFRDYAFPTATAAE